MLMLEQGVSQEKRLIRSSVGFNRRRECENSRQAEKRMKRTTTTKTRRQTVNTRPVLYLVRDDLSALGDPLPDLGGAVELNLRVVSSGGGYCRDRQCLTINSNGRSTPKSKY